MTYETKRESIFYRETGDVYVVCQGESLISFCCVPTVPPNRLREPAQPCPDERRKINWTNFKCKLAIESANRTGSSRRSAPILRWISGAHRRPIESTRMSKRSSIKNCLLSNYSDHFNFEKLMIVLVAGCLLIAFCRPVQSQKVCDQILPIGKYGFPIKIQKWSSSRFGFATFEAIRVILQF